MQDCSLYALSFGLTLWTTYCELQDSAVALCRATINLQPRIRRPRCYSSRAYSTPVAPTADSKRHTLLSALV